MQPHPSYPGALQVVISDAYPLFRFGVKVALESASGRPIRVVAEASTVQQTASAVGRHQPNVCIVGMDFEVTPASESIRTLVEEHPATAFVLLPARNEPAAQEMALRYGAKGVWPKHADAALLPKCVYLVCNGELWFERAITSRALSSLLNDHSIQDVPGWHSLTERERTVAAHVCKGYINKEIAESLNMSSATVAHHLTSVYRKLKVSDRAGLMIFARQHALFSKPYLIKNSVG